MRHAVANSSGKRATPGRDNHGGTCSRTRVKSAGPRRRALLLARVPRPGLSGRDAAWITLKGRHQERAAAVSELVETYRP